MVANVHDDGDAWSAMAELAADTALRAEKAREEMERRACSGRRWPSSRERTRDVEPSAEPARHAARNSCVGRP